MSFQTNTEPPPCGQDACGIAVSFELAKADLSCQICFETMQDPFVTSCGHTFCYACIVTHLRNRKCCPCCSNFLTPEHIFPNFLLCKILRKAAASKPRLSTSIAEQVRKLLAESGSDVKVKDLDEVLEFVKDRRDKLSVHESSQNLQLLLLFLQHAREQKELELKELHCQLKVLEQDLQIVQTRQPSGCGSTVPLGSMLFNQETSSSKIASGSNFGGLAQAGAPSASTEHPKHSLEIRPSALCPSGMAFPPPLPNLVLPFAPNMPGVYPGLPQIPPGTVFPPNMPGMNAVFGGYGSAFSPINGGKLGGSLPSLPISAVTAADTVSAEKPTGQSSNPDTAPLPTDKPVSAGMLVSPHAAPVLCAAEGQVAKPNYGFQPYHQSAPVKTAPTNSKPPSLPAASLFSGCGSTETGNKCAKPAATVNVSNGAGFSSSGTGAAEKGSGQGTSTGVKATTGSGNTPTASGGSGGAPAGSDVMAAARAAKKRKILDQYCELEQCYLQLRSRRPSCQGDSGDCWDRAVAAKLQPTEPAPDRVSDKPAPTAPASQGVEPTGQQGMEGALDLFSGVLSAATHYSRLTPVAELCRPPGLRQGSSCILSSIDFDADESIFATAGVIQRIALYDYRSVVDAPAGEPPMPVSEITTRSKLSSLSFSRSVKQQLLSSDYEGVVSLWDTSTRSAIHEYEAHEKRIWCVDFNPCETKVFASGSDDSRVKLWTTSDSSSIASLDIKANVCSVKWNPSNSHMLAVGSAGHTVHLYDVRQVAEPLHVFSGHKKAVSYVRWLNAEELVSASTDSTLRLWNCNDKSCARLYNGHTNEKNFVGLSCEKDYIACGSETNEVYLYYKGIPKPSVVYSFHRDATLNAAPQHFISAVCWRRSSGALLAANSQGNIWVLSLAQ